ncbi:MAG: hypothetical protein NTW87_12685 [Planctomycetota bacterium]|nr:hypothetical protein [Planctomycetota bacterium]
MARSGEHFLYAASLDLREVPVLVIGGGAVAARKVRSLLRARAAVTAVAPAFHTSFERLRRRMGLRLVRRRFRPSDLKYQRVVFAVTGDMALNTRIAAQAKARGLWVNVAAPPAAGNMQVPAAVHRGHVCIAISTGGASAALARALRERIEKSVGPEWGRQAALLEERRPAVLQQIADPARRRRLLRQLAAPRWARLIQRRGVARAARDMDRTIAAAVDRGAARPAAARGAPPGGRP